MVAHQTTSKPGGDGPVSNQDIEQFDTELEDALNHIYNAKRIFRNIKKMLMADDSSVDAKTLSSVLPLLEHLFNQTIDNITGVRLVTSFISQEEDVPLDPDIWGG